MLTDQPDFGLISCILCILLSCLRVTGDTCDSVRQTGNHPFTFPSLESSSYNRRTSMSGCGGAHYNCVITPWNKSPPAKEKQKTENKIKSQHLHVCTRRGRCGFWRSRWQVTASTAAVKLMGTSFAPSEWELCWGLHCACASAGQLQRGKFKNGVWRIKCNTEKYSTWARDWFTHSSLSPKTGDFF